MPLRRKFKYSIEEHYRRYHNIKDLSILSQILQRDYPMYLSSYDFLLKGNRLFANNMFILKRNDYQNLIEWLLGMLFKLKKELCLESYTGYQERVLGFLSERLISLWIMHHEIKFKELPLNYFKKLKH
ncbi:MAG: hypothetical protein ACI9IP_000347 [Arcticibacterium sp.]|jgi:hypothetical protein